MIRLQIPRRLEYRNLALRLVASACRLVPEGNEDFDHAVISAFSEALNNVVLHARGCAIEEIEVEVDLDENAMTIRLLDHCESFDLTKAAPPDLESLPESGLGVFIMRSFMDDVRYVPGPPNMLFMTKRVGSGKEGTA